LFVVLKIHDGLGSHSAVGLELPLGSLKIHSDLLLGLKGRFEIIDLLLELVLHLGEGVHLVFLSLEVIKGLLVSFLKSLLLLLELSDGVFKRAKFLSEVLDLVLSGVLLLLNLSESKLKIIDILLQFRALVFELSLLSDELVVELFLVFDSLLEFLDLAVKLDLGLDEGVASVLCVFAGLNLSVELDDEIVLGLGEHNDLFFEILSLLSLNFEIFLGLFGFLKHSLHLLHLFSGLEKRLDLVDDVHPWPRLQLDEVSPVGLDGSEGFTSLDELVEFDSHESTFTTGLETRENSGKSVVSKIFHNT